MLINDIPVKYFSAATNTAIIRVSRDHYRLVCAALTFTTHLPKPVERACVMQVVRVSGTIKKAEEEAIRRARLSIKRAQWASMRSVRAGADAGAIAVADAEEAEGVDDFPNFANGIEDPDEPGDEDEESDR